MISCYSPIGYILDNTDCDDRNFWANPAQTEICGNYFDDDCIDDDSECYLSGAFTDENAEKYIEGENYYDYFGNQVITTDKLLIVSAPRISTNFGGIYAYPLPLEEESLPLWHFPSDTPEMLGEVLGTIDANQDQKLDILIGIPQSNRGALRGGAVGIFFAPFETAPADFDQLILGDNSYDEIGSSLTSGDTNDDGVAELLMGSPKFGNSTNFYQGAARLFSPSELDLTISPDEASSIFTGENRADQLSSAMSISDINGDGLGDVLLSAPNWPEGAKNGQVSIFFAPFAEEINAGDADIQVYSEVPNLEWGEQLQSGDYNQDGLSDLAISSSKWETQTGRVSFFLDLTTDRIIEQADFSLIGSQYGQNFGFHFDVMMTDAPHIFVSHGRGEHSYWIDPDFQGTQTAVNASFTHGISSIGWVSHDLNLDEVPDILISQSESPIGSLIGFLGVEQ